MKLEREGIPLLQLDIVHRSSLLNVRFDLTPPPFLTSAVRVFKQSEVHRPISVIFMNTRKTITLKERLETVVTNADIFINARSMLNKY